MDLHTLAMQADQQGLDQTTTQRKALNLLNSVAGFQAILTLEAFRVVPFPHGSDQSWISLAAVAADSSGVT